MNDNARQTAISVEDVLELMIAEQRAGRSPSLDEFVDRFPQCADQLRELYPALAALEQFGSAELMGASTGAPRGVSTTPTPDRLGDFIIVREIGRGGMGVVYEAIQESLGRHVALKILSPQLSANRSFVERFRREAQSAGRLHHTNIVPVFAIGEHDGTYYYAMQFIQGHGLDVVIEEMKRCRQVKSSQGRSGADHLATMIARWTLAMDGAHNIEAPQSDAAQSVDREAGIPSATSLRPSSVSAANAISYDSALSSVTGDGSERTRVHSFYANVARIVLQAAEALSYAHRQGVIHRDVKPSNLMMDLNGGVWLTDFGLAKEHESSNLTVVGDVLGTLRYMAPEQLDGRAAATSDIYGLGATFYELITLRAPFEETSRGAVVEAIRQRDPLPPRAHDRNIPRDLETIVVKALEKEPARRYRSAADLADDVRCFLNDRPIHARRVNALERGWRWCRRNRALALALTAVLFLVSVALPVGMFVHNLRLGREVEQVRAAQSGELAARLDAQAKLSQAYLEQAAATRLSNGVGRRSESLQLVASAWQLLQELPDRAIDREHQMVRLRNEAIAALTSVDLVRVQGLRETGPATGYQVSDSFASYLAPESAQDGSFSIRRVNDQSIVARIDGVDRTSPLLSPDGDWLAVWRPSLSAREIWRVGEDAARLTIPCQGDVVGFSNQTRQIAVVQGPVVEIWDIEQAQCIQKVTIGTSAEIRALAFDAADRRLAVAADASVEIIHLDAEPPYAWRAFDAGALVNFLTFDRQQHWLAVGDIDGTISIWDAATWQRRRLLTADRGGEIRLSFSHDGQYLSGIGWSGVLRVWHVPTGHLVFSVPSIGFASFSRQDNRLAPVGLGPLIGVWQLQSPIGYELIKRNDPQATGSVQMAIHPIGRLVAVTSDSSLALFDLDNGRELVELPYRDGAPTFDQSGNLWLSSIYGVLRMKVAQDEVHSSEWSIGAPEVIATIPSTLQLAVHGDGATIAIALGDGVMVQRGHQVDHIGSGDTRYVSLSPCGRWLAIGNHNTAGSQVFDLNTNEPVAELAPDHVGNLVSFSSDGHSLLVWSGRHRVVDIERWSDRLAVAGGRLQRAALTHDGQMLASDDGRGNIELRAMATGAVVAVLPMPYGERSRDLAFTPDGVRLVATSFDSPHLHVWNVLELRQELARVGLDWSSILGPTAESDGRPTAEISISVEWGPLGLNGLAFRALTRADFESAIAFYSQSLEIHPDQLGTMNNLAWSLLIAEPKHLRDAQRAVELVERVLEVVPDHAPSVHTYALALFRAGQFERSRAALDPLLTYPQNVTAHEWYLLALLDVVAGDLPAAQTSLRLGDDWRHSGRYISPDDHRVFTEIRREIVERLGN